MKPHLASLIQQALRSLGKAEAFTASEIEATLERTRQKEHGDFATKIGFLLAKSGGGTPRAWAERLQAALPADAQVSNTSVAGAGFVNFFLSGEARTAIITRILQEKERFGVANLGRGRRVMVEFVSANPNGPLHVGHGRGAAFGDSLSRLLSAVGWAVHREYYVNDAGRQMDILAVSVWLRYLELHGQALAFPANGYRGSYVRDIARALQDTCGAELVPAEPALADLPPDEPAGGDKEQYVDALIARARRLLGAGYQKVHAFGLGAMLKNIRDDLAEFGVVYDEWFSEHGLIEQGAVARALAALRQQGHAYEQDGALWFRSTAFGDEKDRVLVRENGVPTYFASDIAYHLDKLDRGFDLCLDVWGADHHGHVPRIRAALTALGRDPDALEVLLVQFTVLYRGKERASMSTRSGDFVTLRDLRTEVGNDAARFFYVLRKNEQHMDFDLELAKSQSNDNPVFYIQYAHARIWSVFRQLDERGLAADYDPAHADLSLLAAPEEQALIAQLARYPEVVADAGRQFEPHQVAYYLRDLANGVHSYYNAHGFLGAEPPLRLARLSLIDAARQTLANGLGLLGVSAPEAM